VRTDQAPTPIVTKFDEIVGLSYLCGMHLNDSKCELGSHKDRHENIGLYAPPLIAVFLVLICHHAHFPRGHLGLDAFRNLMNDSRVQNIPLIIETPSFEAPRELWAKEIAVLQHLSRTTMESKENQEALKSIIGDPRSDKELVEMIKSTVKAVQGSQGKKAGTQKTGKKKGGKRKRDEDEDEDEETEGEI
jgi:AP endonuclease-1